MDMSFARRNQIRTSPVASRIDLGSLFATAAARQAVSPTGRIHISENYFQKKSEFFHKNLCLFAGQNHAQEGRFSASFNATVAQVLTACKSS
jgi:hypothetical protein